jgi:hypothetical protein
MVLGRGLVGADEVRVTVAKVLDNEDDAEIEREREQDTLLNADKPWLEAEGTEELLELDEATELDDDAKVEEGIDSKKQQSLMSNRTRRSCLATGVDEAASSVSLWAQRSPQVSCTTTRSKLAHAIAPTCTSPQCAVNNAAFTWSGALARDHQGAKAADPLFLFGRSWKSNSKGSLRKKRTPHHMESRLSRKTDM